MGRPVGVTSLVLLAATLPATASLWPHEVTICEGKELGDPCVLPRPCPEVDRDGPCLTAIDVPGRCQAYPLPAEREPTAVYPALICVREESSTSPPETAIPVWVWGAFAAVVLAGVGIGWRLRK